jgi:hypothetical protein
MRFFVTVVLLAVIASLSVAPAAACGEYGDECNDDWDCCSGRCIHDKFLGVVNVQSRFFFHSALTRFSSTALK